MSIIRLSLSLPVDEQGRIEVCVEQTDAPNICFDVPIASQAVVTPVAPGPESSIGDTPTATEDYVLGGYAGI
jgi:hypothetical protein